MRTKYHSFYYKCTGYPPSILMVAESSAQALKIKQDLENNGCSDQEVNMATQIICRASDCIFNEAKLCTSVEIIYDPAEGCLTHEAQEDRVDLAEGEEVWEEEELEWADEELLLEDETEGWEWEDENALEDEFEEDLDEDTTAM